VNILLTNATDIYAGGEDYVLILARQLRRRGHTVYVSALPGHLLLTKCEADGIPAIPIDYKGMNRVFTVAAVLRKEMQSRAIELVHSNANYDRTCAALAIAWTGIKHVAGVHSTHSIQHNITHWIRNHYGIDHFITDADAGKRVLMKEDSIPDDRITTVPIGIEHDPPDVQKAARARTRAGLGVADDTLVVGNVARLVPFKGHHSLLEAVAQVRRQVPNILFPIIGDGELADVLQSHAARLGIEPVVKFLGFQDQLQEWYPAFDVYSHSSLDMASEMFPIAILRALASGLPVVCTDVGGIAAMVEHGKSGFLVKAGDSAGLGNGLVTVLQDPKLRASMGKASFKIFTEKYTASRMAERVEKVYERTLRAEPQRI
jgi:glycosyltransferase involved in cell wall biosynthesis